MATTLTSPADGELTWFSFPISEKMERDEDGDLVVKGVATDGTVDSDDQIVDTDWSAKALSEWLHTGGNVRMSHDPQRPVGKGLQVELNRDGDGKHWVKSVIVDPVAARLVEKGVLRAYSVGIARPVIKRDPTGKARGGIITGGSLVELSIVDRPSNKSSYLELAKSDAGCVAEFTGKLFGADLLTKEDHVNVDVPKNASITFSPDDLRKLLEHRRIAEERLAQKRDMDPDVGGGVDRDKIPAQDFAGADRSFPIVTPKDVHDASLSLGRARGQDTDKIKRRIISIARRKGDAFVAQLPDAWKAEDAGIGKAKKGKKGKKLPFPGAAPPIDGRDSDGDGADTDKPGSHLDDDTDKPPKVKPGSSKKGSDAVAEVEKGAKDCPKCGKSFHADSKLRNCDGCGADLPNAAKAASPDTASDAQDDADDDDDDGKPMPVDKAGKPTPGDGVTGASDVKPVPAHREPDGEDIEALERDAGLPTVPDASVKSEDFEMLTAMRLKSLGVPTDMGAVHDMLCPGFHPADVATCYPGRGLKSMDTAQWQAKALDAATGAPLDEAMKASAMWQHAVTIQGADPRDIADVQWEAHKAFRDANPGPASFPKPTHIQASSFRRPYLGAGHAAPSPGHDGPNTAPVPSGQISAGQFGRDYLDAGHAANSPSNKGDAIPAPVPPGEPQRVYYRNTQRDHAKNAMQAMHDHIAATFPDLCPMSGAGRGGEAPIGQRPVPVPDASKGETVIADVHGAQVMSDGDMDVFVAKVGSALTAKAVMPDLIKSAVVEAVTPLMARLDEINEELKAERKRTKALQKAVDSLGNRADPNVSAYKGAAVHNPMLAKAAGAPAGNLTMNEIAERTQVAALSAWQDQARNDPDPAQREAAWAHIYEMTGLTAYTRR